MIHPSVQNELQRARRASMLGSVIMLAIFLLALSIFIIEWIAILRLDFLSGHSPLELAVRFIGQASALLAFALLTAFLYFFSKGPSPFGKSQFNKLSVAGVLLLIHTLLEPLQCTLVSKIIISSPIPIEPTSEPSLNITKLAFAAFVICLAMVVRYGNALKEDSDSIL